MAGYGKGGSYPGVNGPRVIAHVMASQVNDFLLRLEELGFSPGEGGQQMNPELKPVVEGLYHVLAGGEVEVKIKHRGNPDIVAELERRAVSATAESNQINKDVGFYLGITL
jgi:hypothetical protein